MEGKLPIHVLNGPDDGVGMMDASSIMDLVGSGVKIAGDAVTKGMESWSIYDQNKRAKEQEAWERDFKQKQADRQRKMEEEDREFNRQMQQLIASRTAAPAPQMPPMPYPMPVQAPASGNKVKLLLILGGVAALGLLAYVALRKPHSTSR